MTLANKKVAVITGGAMGIGAEAASALASDGHHVIICDINTTEAERFAQQLRDQGFCADAFQIDVGTPASVSAA